MNKKYTSLSLSKKLSEAGCELESKYCWHEVEVNGELCFHFGFLTDEVKMVEELEYYLAYDLIWDICIKYAKEFFGEKKKPLTQFAILEFENHNIITHEDEYLTGELVECHYDMAGDKLQVAEFDKWFEPDSEEMHWHEPEQLDLFTMLHQIKIVNYLRQNKKKEAEDYIWDKTIFNPKNK